jgi:rare lipoprotein A
MVSSLTLDRAPTLAWGYRTLFTGAVLVALSAFAKDTAAIALDLPKPANAHPAAQPILATPAIPTPVVKAKRARTSPLAFLRTGLASWYGKVLHEHRTASGTRFDMFEMTAAHRSLPFGSKVKVTDLRSHRSVIVTITDRGVMQADRVIDLSYAAAEELGMIHAGVDPVRLEVLPVKRAEVAKLVMAAPEP